MALTPWVLRDLAYYEPLRDIDDYFGHIYDQNFGVGLFDNDLFRHCPAISSILGPLESGYLRPLRHLLPEESGVSTVSNKKDKFQVNLDVQQFKPEEIAVKVGDGYLSVEGKHEEKKDQHGYISRQFTRRYKLPNNVNLEAITSNISSDGILSVNAPKKIDKSAEKERAIPIERTNKPAIKASNKKENVENMET